MTDFYNIIIEILEDTNDEDLIDTINTLLDNENESHRMNEMTIKVDYVIPRPCIKDRFKDNKLNHSTTPNNTSTYLSAKGACNKILDKHRNRVNYLTQNNRIEEYIPEIPDNPEHTACESDVLLFRYNDKDYYFAAIWGEEDIWKLDEEGNHVLDENGDCKKLKGHGLAHILINHYKQINTILDNLDAACKSLNVNDIKIETDRDGSDRLKIAIRFNNIFYLFKECKEIKGNYFYLHTAH